MFAYGQGRPGLLRLWVGEGDLPTPPDIITAANRSLAAGETFYGAQRGHPDFRKAVARYLARLYHDAPATPWSCVPERIFATIGGMHAVQIALRLLAGHGDEVALLVPAWSNFVGAIAVCGARPLEIPLRFDAQETSARWMLDLEGFASSLTPATRVILLNTPSNPTGWTATQDELRAILDIARARGIWIIADEIYGRYVYDRARAPSLRDIIEPHDRVLFVQTMSKNWAMTGWRVGWLEAPVELAQTIENLILYSTSGVPVFVQRAAIAALDDGEAVFRMLLDRASASRALLTTAFADDPRVTYALPDGAFYLFFAIAGCADSARAALRLVDEAGLGLAPGRAFGACGEGFFRLCFARAPTEIAEAVRRLRAWLDATDVAVAEHRQDDVAVAEHRQHDVAVAEHRKDDAAVAERRQA